MKSMKNYLKDVYIPEELIVNEQEIQEEHQALYENFKNYMLEVNPNISETIIRAQFKRYFENKKH